MASFNTIALGAGTTHSGMASPGRSRSWYDLIVEEEEGKQARMLRMSASEWKVECTRVIKEWEGRELKPGLAYIERMDRERAAYAARKPPTYPKPIQKTKFQTDFALWREMIEEPAKFGDDIVEWLDLDAKLRSEPGRWRLDAYWMEVQMEQEAREEALVAPWKAIYSQAAKEAAVAGEQAWAKRDVKRIVNRIRKSILTIQSAVRGHMARNSMSFRNCSSCLAHKISPIETESGMICRNCAARGCDVSFPWD